MAYSRYNRNLPPRNPLSDPRVSEPLASATRLLQKEKSRENMLAPIINVLERAPGMIEARKKRGERYDSLIKMFENQDIIKSFPSRQDYISNKETQFNVGGVDLNLDDIYQIKQTDQFFENPELKNLIQGLQMDNMIKLFNGEK
tara:strand:+ start:22167 stop:22598 length:432 start_codon:yes stop_codon:yes gene_type:complete